MNNPDGLNTKKIGTFNFETHAWLITMAGIAGIILSLVYFKMGCGYGLEGCINMPTAILNHNYQTAYYLITAVIFLCSGLFLIRKKKIGFILLIITLVLVFISILLPKEIFFDPASYIVLSAYLDINLFSNQSLFLNSIYKAIKGAPLLLLPPIGTIFYFTILIKNIFNLNRWSEYVNDESVSNESGYTRFFTYFLVVIIIIKLLIYISLP